MEFTELLCAKFCHDLAGPVGAVNNGIDFLTSDDKQMQQRAIELIEMSSKQAINRLTFLRQAYGFLQVSSETSITNFKSLVINYFYKSKLLINFFIDKDIEKLDRNILKLALNLTILASTAIMYNGSLNIYINNDKNKKPVINIEGIGSISKIEPEVTTILEDGPETEITTRNVQCFYIKKIAKAINYKFSISCVKDKVFFKALSNE
jgi:histidine phosphotransferase ChpT